MIQQRWLSLLLALTTPFFALADDYSPFSPRIRGMGAVAMLQNRDVVSFCQEENCIAVFCQCVSDITTCHCVQNTEHGPGDCSTSITDGDACSVITFQQCKINCAAVNPDGSRITASDVDPSSQTTFTESAVTPQPTDTVDNGNGGLASSALSVTTTVDPNGAGSGPLRTSSAEAGATTTAASPASTAASGSVVKSSHSGLSTGAKAGIAVGAVVGVALLAVLAFCLFRNRKKRQSPVIAEEAKTLDSEQNGPSIVHPDPYSDSPATGTGYSPDNGRFSWMHAQSPTGPLATGGAAVAAAADPVTSPTTQNRHASRDIDEQDGAAYWQRSSTHMSNPPAESLAGVPAAAPRSSLQHERSPSAADSPTYTAYSPVSQQRPTSAAAAPAAPAAQGAAPEDEWDEDERRLEEEMAEIDRMRQLRDERAALR